jgi:hypothetical protein
LRFETEFGNTVEGLGGNALWSSQAASFFASAYQTLPGYAGAFAWVWGPWSDANAMVGDDNVTTTAWGNVVRNFLAAADVTPVRVG